MKTESVIPERSLDANAADARGPLEFDAVLELVGRYSRTGLGRVFASRVQPSRNVEAARKWLRAAEEMQSWLRTGGNFPIRGATDVRPLLEAARNRGAPLEGLELRTIADLFGAAIEVRAEFEGQEETREALWDVVKGLPVEKDFVHRIRETIDARGEVLAPKGSRLAEIRQRLEKLRDQAFRRIESMGREPGLRKLLRESGPSIRNGRLVLAVREECRSMVRGIYHDRSSSGSTAYVEPEALVDLQNEVVDLHQDELREVARVLRELTDETRDRRETLIKTQRILAAADFTYARAAFADAFGASFPTIAEGGAYRFRRARHPLLMDLAMRGLRDADPDQKLEAARSEIVPFDLTLGDLFDVVVITGPNTGGKTVLLKTAGVLALMAACGIPLTCSGDSEVPFTRAVLADIGDEQNLEQSLSTFSSHVTRIASILGQAEASTLVLLDELGSGTDPAEGEAIGFAILQYLVQHGVRALVSTHLGRLKEFATTSPRAENGSMEFNVSTLAPTYRLTIGLPGESHALKIARRLGLPESVLSDAAAYHQKNRGDEDRMMEDLQRVRHRVQENLRNAENEAENVRALKSDLEQKIDEAKLRCQTATDEADRMVDDILKNARTSIQAALVPFKNVPKHLADPVHRLRETVDDVLNASPLTERRVRYLRTLRKTDLVRLPRYREECRIKRIDFSSEVLEVYYKNLVMTVPFDEVSCPEGFEASSG